MSTLHKTLKTLNDNFNDATRPFCSLVIEAPNDSDGHHGDLIDIIAAHINRVDDLLEEKDREVATLEALLAWRSECGTGPAGGQVRMKISQIIIDIFGEGSAPLGVFDE